MLLKGFLFFTLPNINPFSDYGWFTSLIKAKDSLVPGSLNLTSLEIAEGMHHSHSLAMILSILIALTGIGLAFLMYFKKNISPNKFASRIPMLYKLSLNKFFVDEIYQRYLINPSIVLSKYIAFVDWDLYDKYIVNGLAKITERFSRVVGIRWDYNLLDQKIVDGVGKSANFIGSGLKYVQTGKVQNYLVWGLIGIIFIYVFQAIT